MENFKSLFHYKKKLSHTLFFIVILIWTTALLPQIFAFSESLNIIPMGSVDNYSFQIEIFPWYYAQPQQTWIDLLFRKYSYGYGSFWWAMNSLVVMPFYGAEQAMIVAPRFLSLFFTVAAIILIYLKSIRASIIFALFLIFNLMMNFELIVVSYHFHNHTFLFFLGAICFYHYSDNPSSKQLLLISFILGLGIGVKIVFLPFAIMMLTINIVNYYLSNKNEIKNTILSPLLFIYGYFFGLSPLNAFIYTIPESLRNYSIALKNSTPLRYYENKVFNVSELYRMLDEIVTGSFNLNFEVYIALLFVVTILGFRFFFKNAKVKLLSFIAMYVYLIVVCFYYLKGMNEWDIGKYTLANAFIYILPLFLVIKSMNEKQIKIFSFIAIILFVFQLISFSKDYDGLFNYFTHEKTIKRNFIKKEVFNRAKGIVLNDYDMNSFDMIAFPYGYPKLFTPKSRIRARVLDDYINDDFSLIKDFKGCALIVLNKNMKTPKKAKILFKNKHRDKIVIVGETCKPKTDMNGQ